MAPATPARGSGGQASVASSMLVTFGANAVYLAVGLFTGVLSARLLEPSGRGEVGVVVAWSLMAQLIASVGLTSSSTYDLARHPEEGRRILPTTVLLALGLSALGIVAVELLVPVGMASQTESFRQTARLFLVMVAPIMLTRTLTGIFLGRQRFLAAALLRLGQPLILAGGLVALWVTDNVTVSSVLAVHLGGWAAVALVALLALARQLGVGPPSTAIGRRILSYGVRVHGQSLGSMANVRLDVMVMPALLAAEEIGLYVVAVSAASVVMPLFAQVKTVIFSVTARSGQQRGLPLMERTLRITLLGSFAVALGIGLFAPFLVRLVYGSDFLGSVSPLRLLLPGVVAWSAAAIVASGLNAIGRPGAGSIAQGIGVAITVPGLAITLPTMGIDGAALTTSVSYTTVLLVQLLMLRREPEFELRRALAPTRFVADLRDLPRQLRSVLRGRSGLTARRRTGAPSAGSGQPSSPAARSR